MDADDDVGFVDNAAPAVDEFVLHVRAALPTRRDAVVLSLAFLTLFSDVEYSPRFAQTSLESLECSLHLLPIFLSLLLLF